MRAARPADLPRLRALQSHLSSPWPDLLELGVEGAGPTVLVSTDDDRPVGYALALPGEDDVVHVVEVVVAPEHRREGRASALLDAVAARFGEREELRLTARADDERALAFYRESGFREVRRLPDHYDDAEGILLARPL